MEMGRTPSSPTEGLNKGAWTEVEDKILRDYIDANGEGKWSSIPKKTSLRRCGKSCRLRWLNYLRPDIKRGNISEDEEELIIRLHKLLGNRWSLIAGRLPGRTDNEIKNYWNTIVGKKVGGQPLRPSTSHRASTASRNPRRRPIPKVSPDKKPEEVENKAQCRNCIDSPEPQAATTRPEMTIDKDCGLDDFELENQLLLDLLGLDDNNNEHKEENDGSIANLAGDNEMISRAPSCINSEDAIMSHEFMLELGETDLQSIASFLSEGELDQLLCEN